jgi:hypothetical protein
MRSKKVGTQKVSKSSLFWICFSECKWEELELLLIAILLLTRKRKDQELGRE